jgi:uncharacterized protein YjiS (DUF1127 family)
MATFWHNVPQTVSTPVSTPSAEHGFLNRIAGWFRALREDMELRDELASLSERDLHDLGITPADFDSIARGTYQR